MARATPRVVDDRLTSQPGREPIVVGSPAWFAWLEQARLFTFSSPAGTFTARQEARARGGAYWRAYRTVGGRQRRVYLGRSADLTPARLWAAAAQLAAEVGPPASDGVVPPAGAAPPPTSPSPLLATKLFVPRRRSGQITRHHLHERLAAGLRGPLTLIAAPAGFGKTTLLADFLAGLPVSPGPGITAFAWLSLDAGDNDPAVFLRYLVAALERALPGATGAMALALLEAPQPPPPAVILTALINDLAGAAGPVALILDDYHVISTGAIHAALNFLVEHLPPALRIVIASREDPPLPLARLRARGQLAELRAADLRFGPDEAATFLNEVMGLGLGAADVAALERRTEGWIAGLQLAALAIYNHAQRESFVGGFTGSNRFIVDYLVSEVLDRLSGERQTFLLATSLLDRMCGPLCDAMLGHEAFWAPGARPPDSSLVLEELERANLFLIPLDAERRWYRYHQLFAEVLRERLARTWPAAVIAGLHLRASAWFERHDLVGEAIGHALAAGDSERAADLIEPAATGLALDGQYVTLAGWLAQLPAELLQTRPHLALARVSVASLNADYATAEVYLRQVDDAARRLGHERAAAIQSEVAAHRSLIASLHGDARSLELGQAALARLSEDHPLRNVVAAGLGYALFYTGDLAAAGRLLQECLDAPPAHRGQLVVATSLLAMLAMVRRAQGRLREVLLLSTEAVQRATYHGHTLPLSGVLLAYLLLGLTLCERNELDEAEAMLSQCARLAGEYQVEQYAILARFYLGQVLCARGDLDGALAHVEQVAASAARHLSPLNLCEIEGYRAMLWLRRGDLDAASRWATDRERAGGAGRPRFSAYDYDRFALVEVALAQGRREDARAAVERLLDDAEASGHGRYVIWALVLRALILQSQGEAAAALDALGRALALAEPEGYVRVFADAGEPLAALLAQLARHGPQAPYAARLLAAFPARREARGARLEGAGVAEDAAPPGPPLAEPLSEREREVLRLLAEGYDNAAIARALVVAVSTVKSHLNHIFGKLGVSTRLEAALRARQLNLL